MRLKKSYLIRVVTVSLLLSAVIISSVFSFLLGVIEEEIGNPCFVFSVFYSLAWFGIILLANKKKWATVQCFSVIYLGMTAILFLLLLVLSLFTSIKLPSALSLAVMLEIFPFFGWSLVIDNSIALPIFCFALSGGMAALAAVPFLKKIKKK